MLLIKKNLINSMLPIIYHFIYHLIIKESCIIKEFLKLIKIKILLFKKSMLSINQKVLIFPSTFGANKATIHNLEQFS